MGQICSPSTQRRYGLARVCRVWELGRVHGVSGPGAADGARRDSAEARPEDAVG
jgi:hypothetical protein